MDEVRVSTVVYLPPEEIFAFLVDFPRYAKYSKHLTDVRQYGDGEPGTEYDLRFSWWKLHYTARSRVTSVEPPERLDWKVTKDVNAHGHWQVEEVPDEAPADRETASRVSLSIVYDTSSARRDAIDLPRFVSLGWVVDRVTPLVLEEAERIVERIVADLEGETRPVELTIHDSVH